MREIVFRNTFKKQAMKRIVSIEEIVEDDEAITKVEKTSKYFVKNVKTIKSKKDFENWVEKNKANPSLRKRGFHILKSHSDKDHTDKILCKAIGAFYVIVGKNIYNIVFLHTVRMEIIGVSQVR